MAAQTSMLHIWVDDDIKEQATAALATMGLSVSDAERIRSCSAVDGQAGGDENVLYLAANPITTRS